MEIDHLNKFYAIHSDCGTIIFCNKLYADDGYGNYIESNIRIAFYFMYNWVM